MLGPHPPRDTLSMLPFLSSGKHTTQAQTPPTSKSSIFFLPRHIACGLSFLSSRVLTYHQPLKFCRHAASQTSQSAQAQVIVVYCGFLAGEALYMRRVTTSCGLCYLGSRPITTDPTIFQEHNRTNNTETLPF